MYLKYIYLGKMYENAPFPSYNYVRLLAQAISHSTAEYTQQ